MTQPANRISKIYFCPACGAPARLMPREWQAPGLPSRWIPTCAHAIEVSRMGRKRAEAITAAFVALRGQDGRTYIASCTGAPVVALGCRI